MPARISKSLADALCASREQRSKPAASSKRGNKFGAVRTVIDGESFDSKGEALRWNYLRLLQMAGEISELKRQVPFALHVGAVPIGKFIADFTYRRNGQLVAEDFKGGKATQTPLFKWKRRHFEAEYGLKLEVSQ